MKKTFFQQIIIKKVDTVLNIKNDNIKMFGHYSISILPEIMSNFDDIEELKKSEKS